MGDFFMENYFVESRKHIRVILTIMENMLKNGKATREEYRDIFIHWYKWLMDNDAHYGNINDYKFSKLEKAKKFREISQERFGTKN